MSIANNRSIGRRLFEDTLSTGNWDVAHEFVSPDVVLNHPSSPAPIKGFEGFKGFLSAYRIGFPDLHITVLDEVADEDKVAVLWNARGTHTGNLFGIPPSGKKLDIKGISFLRIANGKIVEDTIAEDSLGAMQEIGVIPPLG